MSEMCVESKDLRPGDVIALPTPSAGAAVQELAEVLGLKRVVRRAVDSVGRIFETDDVSIQVETRIHPSGEVGKKSLEVSGSHNFFLYARRK